MIGLSIIFAQLISPAAASPLPDIEIRGRIEAQGVEVEQEGEVKIELRVEPGEIEPVWVNRSAPAGQRSYRDLTIDVRAAAHISDPATISVAPVADKQKEDSE